MRFNLWKVSTLALAGALTVVTGTSMVRDASAEPQPHMMNALDALVHAQTALGSAATDKGGHRLKALDLTAKAIDEVKAGIAYANTH